MTGPDLTLVVRGRRRLPLAGTGLWVWAVIAAMFMVCAALVVLQARQMARTKRTLLAIRELRSARVDLAKGFLHLAEADEVDSPFSRKQGLAHLRQAMDTLERREQSDPGVITEPMREALGLLRRRMIEWTAERGNDPESGVGMSMVFHAVEREADELDARLRDRVSQVSVDNRREFLVVTTGAGLSLGVVCASILVLQRRGARAARATREADRRFAAVMENLAEGLILADAQGRLLECNPAVVRMHGLADAAEWRRAVETVRRTYTLETLEGEVLPYDQWPLQRLLRGEEVRGVELRLRRVADEWERIFSYGGAVVRDGGAVRFAFLTIGDVTARSAAERGIRELNAQLELRVARRTAELEAKNRELEMFTYSVSHDLKAPLRGIDGYSRLLLEDYSDKLDEDGRRFLHSVRQASSHMGQLIDDLLAYSRLERRVPQTARVRAAELVRSLLDAVRGEIEARGVKIVVSVPEDVELMADAQGLMMALRNLIDNALKFTRATERPEIEIGARREGIMGVIWVKDNGIGFDMRFIDRIFDIFQRLHRAEDYPGTGIGLAIVRKAMERAGGRAWAESTPGRGATFFLELPHS